MLRSKRSTPPPGPWSARLDTLTKAGKPAEVAITAVRRKLVILADALLRDDRLWTPKAARPSRILQVTGPTPGGAYCMSDRLVSVARTAASLLKIRRGILEPLGTLGHEEGRPAADIHIGAPPASGAAPAAVDNAKDLVKR